MAVIPDYLLRPSAFESLLPTEGQLKDITSSAADHEGPFLPGMSQEGALQFGRRYMSNATSFTQFEYAGVANKIGIPAEALASAEEFFGIAGETLGGSLDSFKPGIAVPQLLGQFAQLADTLGAFESVPIVGWILSIGLAAWNIGSSAWISKHTKELEALPFDYSKDADEYEQREVLRISAQEDQTETFMPYVDGSGGIKTYNVELMAGPLGAQTKVARKVAVPRGSRVGMGVIPGIPQIPRGWMYATHWNVETRSTAGGVVWSAYRPGLQQTGTLAWNGVLADTRRRYFVSTRDLSSAWSDFYGAIEELAFKEGSKRARWWISLHQLGEQYSLVPEIPEKYYTRGVPEGLSQSLAMPMWGGDPHVRLTMRGVVQFLIDRQLRSRQVNGLGTLLCAYVSDNDAAFDGDSQLKDLLKQRRQQLLKHQGRYQVDLDRVPDGDFRSAIVNATRTAPGQMGLKPGETKRGTLSKLPTLPDGGGDAPTISGVPVIPRKRKPSLGAIALGGGALLYLLARIK